MGDNTQVRFMIHFFEDSRTGFGVGKLAETLRPPAKTKPLPNRIGEDDDSRNHDRCSEKGIDKAQHRGFGLL